MAEGGCDGHGATCSYRACCKITETDNKRHRAETERFQNRCPEKAAPAERSWRGVLRGHVPSKSLSADSEIPCAMFWRTEKVGEKSDSFSRAERTRPLRPVCRLLLRDFENVPVERFQRDFPFLKPADTARRVPTKPKRTEHLANCAQLDQPYVATVLKLFCFCTMRFVIVSALMCPAMHFFEPPHFPAGILWYNILVPNRGNHAEP